MANDEHFELLINMLDEGVDAWNRWRNENQAIVPHLMGVNLSSRDIRNIDLSNCYLRQANLRDANLNGANLSGADLSDVNLSLAKLNNSNFSNSYLRRANLKMANLRRADLRWADLRWADLKWADLKWADLKWADLRWTDLEWSELWEADFRSAKLWEADFRSAQMWEVKLNNSELCRARLNSLDLSRVKLKNANLKKANLKKANLIGANLKKANLIGANLSGVDLSEANLTKANLSKANLSRTQALRTDFTGAKFTGACLEDWHINSNTKLNDIDCQYVYLKSDFFERRPSSGEFAPGDFSTLFQKVLQTVDLIFGNGINWKAFLLSFKELQVEYGEENLSVQAIEKKSRGTFIIRLEVLPEANKAQIEFQAKALYETQLKALEEKYRQELQAKDDQIIIHRQQNATLENIIYTLADRPLQNIIYNSNQDMSNYELNNSKFGGGFSGDKGTTIGGNLNDYSSNIDYSSKHNLAEAAVEILQLVRELQNQGCSPEEAQNKVATDLANQAQKNPAIKEKLTKWGEYVKDAATTGVIGDAAVVVLKLALGIVGIQIP